MDFRQFHEDLLKTLRHAANLRNVEPNESVIVTIIAHEESGAWPAPAAASAGPTVLAGVGGSKAAAIAAPAARSARPAAAPHADSRTRSSGSIAGRGRSAGWTGPAPGLRSGTVLTLQAKKADIDAFAKGGLSFEQFQQRVKTFTY